jgi:hypothetical protein
MCKSTLGPSLSGRDRSFFSAARHHDEIGIPRAAAIIVEPLLTGRFAVLEYFCGLCPAVIRLRR